MIKGLILILGVLSISLVGCATGLNIQKKCKQLAQIDAQGGSHVTEDYVCE